MSLPSFNPSQPFPSPAQLPQTLFPATSRYHGLEVKTLTQPNGKSIAYLARRFVPQPERFATLLEHEVHDKERPDHLAAQYLGDAEQFWRIADANHELDPFALTAEPGRTVRITLPEGIPGLNHA
jgi:hypothetical protein